MTVTETGLRGGLEGWAMGKEQRFPEQENCASRVCLIWQRIGMESGHKDELPHCDRGPSRECGHPGGRRHTGGRGTVLGAAVARPLWGLWERRSQPSREGRQYGRQWPLVCESSCCAGHGSNSFACNSSFNPQSTPLRSCYRYPLVTDREVTGFDPEQSDSRACAVNERGEDIKKPRRQEGK